MSIPALRHSSATMLTGSTGYPSSMSSANNSQTDEQAWMRAASITNTLRAADDHPLGISEAGSGRRDLRVVHRAPVVFPQSEDRNHAGAPVAGDDELRSYLRSAVRCRVLGVSDLFG